MRKILEVYGEVVVIGIWGVFTLQLLQFILTCVEEM